MIEHTGIAVKDFKKARKFYIAALKPLGYKLNYDFADAAGFMEAGHTSFWIMEKARPQTTHLAFRAKSKKAVQDFYTAAMKAGAKDNGAPGPRPRYSADYYAAFVLDESGNNIEAVYYNPKAR